MYKQVKGWEKNAMEVQESPYQWFLGFYWSEAGYSISSERNSYTLHYFAEKQEKQLDASYLDMMF